MPTRHLALLLLLPACHHPPADPLDGPSGPAMAIGVTELTTAIAGDLAREGPKAWLRHFRRSPAFFMASEGQMVFPGNDSADVFVRGLATRMRHIELSWGDLRIDSLAPHLALIAAPYREVLTDTAGRVMREAGFFTGVAERVDSGWQLRNAHWSVVTQGQPAQ